VSRAPLPTENAIAQLIRRRASDVGGIVRADRGSPLVASHQQEGLWIHSLVEPSPNAFRVAFVLRLLGPLDDRAFAKSIEHVVERHEILRTSFRVLDGRLTQVVGSPGVVPLERIDLRGHAAEDAEKQFMEFASTTTLQIDRGPLWRAALVRFGEREFRLWVFIHHIVWDGWSAGVFLRELQLGYEAFVHGQEPVVPALPLQYVDFAASQRRRFELRHEEQLAYWTRRLEGARRTELPRDGVSPPSGRRRGGSHDFRLGSTCVAALRQVAKRSGANLFHAMLAGFAVALSRWTGNDDPIVAAAASNRSVPGTAQLIGFFVSMLPLRLDLSDAPTVESLVARARATTLEALLNSDIPTTSVVAAFRSPDRRRNMPLGDIVMSFLPAGGDIDLDDDVRVSFIPPPTGWDRDPEADLALWVWEGEKDVGCLFIYDAAVLSPATVERMAGHLRRLLVAMAAHPERRVTALPMLSDKERHQLVVEFSSGAKDCSGFVPREDLSIEEPLGNTRAYVLDDELNPVPIGVAGHLYLGGEGLARAHLAQSDRTARWLLPDPFGTPHGGRLYRTGKLVRWLPDGHLEFLRRPQEALEQPGPSAASSEYVAPRTPDEQIVANVWRTLLRVERVGVTDNFFELGGHSFLAMQAVARLQDEFDVDLPVIVIFEAPTVEELAERILELQLSELAPETVGKILE
jgi:acyl carrier protein